MSIGSFILIKQEAEWIAPHLDNWLPWLDEMIFYDGGSTDGTLEIIREFQKGKYGHRIKLFEDKDPKDLRDDYVRLFDECMRELSTDLAFFLHPDMHCENPEQVLRIKDSPAIALSTHMESYAGEPGGQLYKIVSGRHEKWKNIYRLRNPDLGAHYHGHYGAAREDVYFRDITGDSYNHYGPDLHHYPYIVEDSGLKIRHFSDVRSYERRLGRMVTCMKNQNKSEPEKKASVHPRVTLKDGGDFKFVPAEYPKGFLEIREKYKEKQCA